MLTSKKSQMEIITQIREYLISEVMREVGNKIIEETKINQKAAEERIKQQLNEFDTHLIKRVKEILKNEIN